MRYEGLISAVSRPARYLGGEAGSVVKDPAGVKLTLALAFPEVYEIAMSHLGLKILYQALAPRPEVAAERVFMPWRDLMELMRAEGLAPWSLESGRPLHRFDAIGFSLQYELTYTNLLWMLKLAGIPLRRSRRGPQHPLVLAGGPCMVNPEPMAEFMDLIVVGEAEELIHPLVDLLIQAKQESWDRDTIYARASSLEGVYAPALYRPLYDQQGRLRQIQAQGPAPARVRRRLVADLEAQPVPVSPVVPAVKPVHDRFAVELARGCTRGCRFCQAGFIYRPVRERSPATVMEAALQGLAASGQEELGLLSLSSGDYTCIEELAAALMDLLEPRRWSLSLPSLRVDSISRELAAQLGRVRKGGFTVAPEAGSQRLRDLINKDLTHQQILTMARRVYSLGWNHVKLYFMVGLPGEREEDLDQIGRLCQEVAAQARRRDRKPLVHASLGIFVPKPHTPFQWEAQVDLAEAERRLARVKAGLGDRRVKAKWNSPRQAVLEGVLSRGDRRLARALELAVEAGCCFDGWSEELDLAAWLGALAGAGLRVEDYLRARRPEEVLPWDHIEVGVDKDYLWAERSQALAGRTTPDCRGGRCQGCGVCDFEQVRPRLHPQPPPPPSPPPPPPEEESTYVFRLEKTGPARFLGHLEMITQITRAFQRAGVPLAYSRGYHPHPQVKTDSALPLGVESLVERLVVKVRGTPDARELARRVNAVLPRGLRLAEARRSLVKESLREPEEVTYLIRHHGLDPERIRRFQQASSAVYVRNTPKGQRSLDLKAAVKSLAFTERGLEVVVARAGGRPKPAEILSGIFGLSSREAQGARALKIGAGG